MKSTSRRAASSLALAAIVALALVSSPARAATSTFTFETNYVATGIDQWGSTSDGYANSTTYQNFFGTTWDESIDFGGFSYGLFGEKYGFKGNAFTNGKVGLDVYFKGSTGSVDIHSANTVNLEVSNLSIASGATGLIHVNQNKIAPTSGNTLTSVFPTMEFSVDATFQIDAGVSGEFAYGVGSSSGTVDLADVKNVIAVATLNPLLLLSNPFDTKLRILSYNLNNSHDVTIGLSTNNTIFGSPKETLGLEIPVLNLDSPAGLRLPLSLGRFMPERRIGDYDVSLNTEVEFGNVVLHSPYALDLASGVGNVASGHQDQIIGLAIDPIGIATLAAGFPINPLAPKIGIPGTPLSVEATLLEAQLQLDMGLNQTLTFAPNTYVRLLSNYDVTYSINGQTVTSSDLKYLLPSDGSDFDIQITGKPTLEPDDEPWTLTPTVYSTPTLQNTLDLNFSTSLDVTAGELGLVYEGLIPLPIIPALYHENFPFGDLGAINLINRTLTLGNLTEFQQVYRSLRPLVGGAVPKDFSVLLGEYIVDDEVSGTFKAQPIAGTLILTNSSFDNATALEVPGTFQLKGQSNIAGSAGLTVTGALKIDKGSRFIDSGTVDANGDPLLDGNGRRIAGFVDANGLVSSGTFNIAGRLSYEGADIDKIGANAKFILVGDPADPTHPRIDNGGADAFAHLHWIDGSLSLTNLDISTDQLLVNHGTLALLGDSNLTARGYDSNAAANLAIAGGNVLDVSGGTFGRVDAAGALTGFNAALGDLTGASIIYNGFGGAGITAKPGITSNSGDLILSGTRPANGYIIRTTGASTFVDGLATLAANSGTLVLANGATQTLTGSFSNTKTVGITMPTTPAVPVAPFTTLTVAGGFTNFKDVIIDGGILAAGSFTQTSTGLLQLTRGAEVNLTGAIGGLSGSGNTTLGSGKWYLDGTVTYTGNPIVTIGTDTDVRISGAGHGFALNDGSNAYRNLAVNNGYFVLSSGATAASTVAFSNTNQLTVNANSSFTTRGLTENSGNISIVQTGSYDTTGAIPSLWASTNSIPLTPAGLLTGGGTTNVAGTLTFSGPAPSGGSGSPLTGVAAGTTLAINHTSLYAPTNTSYVFNEALVSRNPTTGAAGNGFANFSTIAGTLMLSGGSGSRTDASLAVIGGGLLTVDKGSTLQITGASFTTIPITLNSDSHVIAGTVLNGNLILGGGANTTTFSVPDNFVFSGTTQLGREVLKASGGVSYYETTGKGALSSAASWTNNGEITGVGNVKGHSITNTGVIYATGGNVPAGDALLIDNSAGTGRGAITNTGNIGSGGNGLYSSRLTISGMDIANSVTNGSVVTKGQLFASSNLDLQHSTVTGGFVNIAAVTARDLGTGVTSVTARGRLSLLDSTLTGVTLTSDGYIDILNDNGGSSTIGGTILLKPAAILTVRGNGATGATLIVGSGSTFTNTGTIRLEDGANFSGSTITNQALITIAGGRTGPLDNIDNTINGIVTLDHGTNLQLNGAFSNAGRIELSGESATEPLPGGATISHSTITLLGNATLSGGGILQLGGYNTIGTITASNGATIRTTNTQWRNGANDLGNVTIVGTAGTEVLTISNQTLSGQGLLGNGTLSLINDTNGTIRVLGNGSTLAINTNSSGFTNRGTLDIGAGSTMSITGGTFHSFTPAASGANAILAQGRYRIAGTLAINGLTDFDNAANIVFSGSNVHFTDQIGNERVLLNNLATGSLEVRDGAAYSIPTTAGRHFTNAGTLVASAGGTLGITGDYFTNFASQTLTGGSYDVGGTLQFKNADIINNAASITLRGASPHIQDLNGNNALIGFANNTATGTFSLRDNTTYTTAVPTFTQSGHVNIETGSTLDFGTTTVNNAGGAQYWIGGTLRSNSTFSTTGTGITLFGNAARWRVGTETLPMNIGAGGRVTFAGAFEGDYTGGYNITNNGLWEIGSPAVLNASGQTIRSGGYAKFGNTTDFANITGTGITRLYGGPTDDGTQLTGTYINNFPRALYVDRLRVSGGGTLDANGIVMFGPSGRLELRQATFANSLSDTNFINTDVNHKGELDIVGGLDLDHALNLNGATLKFTPASGFPIKLTGVTFYFDEANFSSTNVSLITLTNNAKLLLRSTGASVLEGFTRNDGSITLSNTAGYIEPVDLGGGFFQTNTPTNLTLVGGLQNFGLLAINEHSTLTLGGGLLNFGTVNVITTIPENPFNHGSSITMNGDLTNFGAITTSGGKITTTGNFYNGFGIYSDTNTSFSGSITVYGDLVNSAHATFSGGGSVGGNFINFGTITSAGFSVGGAVDNRGDLSISSFSFSHDLTTFSDISNTGILRTAGTIRNDIFGNGTIHTTGFTALRGDNSGFSGHVIVDSGAELDITADTQLGSDAADLAVNGTLALQSVTLDADRAVSFNNGSTLEVSGGSSILGPVNISGGMTISGLLGSLTLQLAGYNDAGLTLQNMNVTAVTNGFTLSRTLAGNGNLTVKSGFFADGSTNLDLDAGATMTGTITMMGDFSNLVVRGNTFAPNVVSDGSVKFFGNTALSYGGIISGSADVTLLSGSQLTFTRLQTYTGLTTINSGTSLTLGGFNGGVTGSIVNNGTLVFDHAGDFTLGSGSSISGTGGITQAGSGRLTILDSSFLNHLTVANGTVSIGDGTTAFNGTLPTATNNSHLWFNHTGSVTATVAGTGDVVNLGPGNLTLTLTSDYHHELLHSGGGTLTLPGNQTFTGATRVNNQGTLVIVNDTSLGTAPATYTADQLYLGNGSTLRVTGFDVTLAATRGVHLGGATVYTDGTLTIPTSVGDGILTKTGFGRLNLVVNSAESTGFAVNSGALHLDNLGAVAFLGTLTSALNTDLIFAGTGTTTAVSSANNINGHIVIESGTLGFNGKVNAPVASSLYNGVVDIAAGAALISRTPTNEFYSIKGAGSFTAQGGLGTTIATNVNVGSVTVSDLTLASDYYAAGATTLNQAKLQIGQNGSTGSLTLTGLSNTLSVPDEGAGFTITGGVTNSGGTFYKAGDGTLTLDGSSTISTNIAVLGGHLFLHGAPTLDGVVSGDGGIFAAGTAITDRITFTKNQTYTGGTFITVGELMLGTGGTTGSVIGEINTGSLGSAYAGVAFNRSGTYTLANTITGKGYLRQASAGTLVINSSLLYTDSTGATPVDYTRPLIISQGTVQLDDGAEGLGKITNTGALVFNNTDALELNPIGALGEDDNISGTGIVTQLGTGTTTLGGTNTYTGATTITHGTLAFTTPFANTGGINVANDGTLGISDTGAILGTIANAGTVALNRNDDYAINFTTTGSGIVTQNGTGIVTLGSLNHTNAFNIAAGTLRVNVSNIGDTATLSNALHGAGTFSKWGSGTLIMTAGTDGELGSLHVEEGNVRLTGGSYAAPITVDVATALEIAGNISLDRTIAGAGQLKINTGTLSLTGTATHAGGSTIVSGATLTLHDGGSVAGSIADNGSIVLGYGSPATFAANTTGTGTMLQQGSGKVTLTGTNEITGTTTINSGTTLALGPTGTLTGPIANSGTFEVLTGGGTNVIRSNISGSGTVRFTGGGTVFTESNLSYAGQTTVDTDTTFEFRNASSNTLSTSIVGQGNFLRSGTGTLVVTGFKTLGGTVTNGATGTLQFGDGVTDGAISGPGGIVNQGALVFNSPSPNASFDGAIIDTLKAGTVRQSGGMLTFNGSVQSSNLIVDAGHIVNLGSSATLDSKLEVNGTFYNLHTGDFTLTNALTGASTGRYVQSGTGILKLVGTGAFAGTLVTSGTIEIGLGNHSVTLDRLQATGLTNHSGLTITGDNAHIQAVDPLPSGFIVTNDGTLTLGNGGTTGSLGGSINSPGTLAINHSNDFTLGSAVKLSGNGIVRNLGTGTLRINDDGAGGVVANSFQALNGTIEFERPIAELVNSQFSTGAQGTIFLHDGSYPNRIVNDGALKTQGVVTLTNTFNTYAGAINVTKFSSGSTDSLTLGGSAGTTGADQTIGSLQGDGNFLYTGSGNLTLTNGSTLTGTLTTAGNRISTGGSLSSPITFTAGNGTLEFTNSAPATLAGSVSGSSALSHTGTGALTLANPFSGTVVVTSGALNLGASGTLAGSLTLGNAAGASFALSGHDTTLSHLSGGGALGGNIALGANTLTVNQIINQIPKNDGSGGYTEVPEDTTFAGVISGSGKLVKQGLATLELSGANTFTGGLDVTGGTLALSGTMASTGNYNIEPGATLAAHTASNLGGGVIALHGGSFQSLGSVVLPSAQNLTISDAGLNTVSHPSIMIAGTRTVIAGTLGGDLTLNNTVAGSGLLVVDGGRVVFNGSSAYQGGMTYVKSGTLALGHIDAVDHANTRFASGSTFDVNGIAVTPANWTQAIDLDGATLANGSATPVTFSHDLAIDSSLTLAGTGSRLTFSGALTGSGSVGITSVGSVTLTTPSAARIDSIAVPFGTLSTPLADLTTLSSVQLTESGGLTFTGAVQPGGQTLSLGTLSLSNQLDVAGDSVSLLNNTTGGTVTINTNLALTERDGFRRGVALIGGSGDTTLSGTISGELSLTKVGTGNLTLSGLNVNGWNNANSGARLGVREGTLTTTTSLLANRGLVVENTGVLALTDSTSNALQLRTLAGNGTLDLGSRNLLMTLGNSSTFTGSVVTTGNITHSSSASFPIGPSGGTQTYGTLTASNLTVNSGNVVVTGQLNADSITVIASGAGGSLTTTTNGISTNGGTILNGNFASVQGSLRLTGGQLITGNAGYLKLEGASATVLDGNGAVFRFASNDGTLIARANAGFNVASTFTNNGHVTLNQGFFDGTGTVNQAGGDFSVSSATLSATRLNITGGTFTISPGANIQASGPGGSVLTNPGVVLSGGLLEATGFILGRGLEISGGTLAPGGSLAVGQTRVTGGVIFGAGGSLAWDIINATGDAGSNTGNPGYDWIDISGGSMNNPRFLTVNATAANPFTIAINSVSVGNVANFNDTLNYAWNLATVSAVGTNAAFSNFATNKFVVDPSGFSTAYTGNFGVATSGNNLQVVYNYSHVFNNTGDLTDSGGLGANGAFGGLTKSGGGTLTLDGVNTYTGETKITDGTVLVTNAGALGSADVLVTGNGKLSIPEGTAITNPVVLNGGSLERTLTGDLAHSVDSSTTVGDTKMTASLLAGNAASSTTLTTSFKSDSIPADGLKTIGEIYELHGTGNAPFVLQLSFASIDDVFNPKLAWLDTTTNLWVNAIDGNTGNNASFGQIGYQGTFASFQTTYGTDLSTYMGAWGGFIENNTTYTWAVLNHNSTFGIAAVPEPSSWGIAIGAALLGLALLRRRRASR